MNRGTPFGIAIIIFIIVWASLLQLPFIESISSNKAITYATISMFISIIVFVVLASIYRFEHMNVQKEILKQDFLVSFDDLFVR